MGVQNKSKMPRRRSTPDNANNSPPKKRRYDLRKTTERRKRILAENPEGRTNILTDEEFRKKASVLKEKKKPGKALSVVSINTCAKSNRKSHNTYDYDTEDAIFRRGQEFILDITFDRDYDVDNDIVTLQFVYGSRPKESKGTVIRIQLNLTCLSSTKDIGQCWEVFTKTRTSTTLRVFVTPSSDSCIGYYDIYTETKLKDDDHIIRYLYPGRFILIFNPWCKDDSVFMDNDTWRKEYVMNDSGKIWVGNRCKNTGRPWNFGQFDEPVLDAVLYLLDKAELSDQARNSPVSIVRTLSSFVNSLDNNGILEGRWTKEYPEDSTKPTAWTGSVPIIKEFMETKEPVRYGQCWVFSGLITTLLRAIGIPARSVTNFESAHDTDCSMTIDRHYNEKGEPLEYLDDSVWNFHVWNECWFKRYDLPDGYDGWQVLDGTPQELSEGIMRCGPAPVKAIKEGHVYLNYDVGFVYSEVNGDRIVWKVKEVEGTMKVMQIDSHSVGWNISTKSVGSDDVELLDNQYKYPEFSEEERKIAKFVNRFSTRRKENIYKLESKRELDFSLLLPENTMVGEDFTIHINVKNVLEEKKSFVVKTSLVNSYYTGIAGTRVKTQTFEDILEGNEEKRLTLSVTYKEYGPTMNPEGRFQIFVTGKDVSTGEMNAAEESFILQKPAIMIEVPEEVEFGEESEATVRFKNATCFSMTRCTFHVESPGALESQTIENPKPLKPGEEWSETVKLKPRRKYRDVRELVADFSCDELVGINGSKTFTVVNNRPDSEEEEECL